MTKQAASPPDDASRDDAAGDPEDPLLEPLDTDDPTPDVSDEDLEEARSVEPPD